MATAANTNHGLSVGEQLKQAGATITHYAGGCKIAVGERTFFYEFSTRSFAEVNNGNAHLVDSEVFHQVVDAAVAAHAVVAASAAKAASFIQ